MTATRPALRVRSSRSARSSRSSARRSRWGTRATSGSRRADDRVEPRRADYELLAPRMLGLALLAPYFIWMIGRSLADLPLAQRVIAVAAAHRRSSRSSRSGSRASRAPRRRRRSAPSTSSTCRDSVPDAALEDARAEVQKGLDAKPNDALVRVVTFARRPRVVPLADDARRRSRIARHDAARRRTSRSAAGQPAAKTGLGAGTDIASALAARVRPLPGGLLASRRPPLRRRADRRRHARRGEPRARLRREALRRARTAVRCPARSRCATSARPITCTSASRSSSTRRSSRAARSRRRSTLKQGEAINGLDGVRTVDLQPGDNDVPFKSVVRVAGEVTYALDVDRPDGRSLRREQPLRGHRRRARPPVDPLRRREPAARELPRGRARRAGARRRRARPERAALDAARARTLRLRHPERRARRGESRSRSRTRSSSTCAISAAASSSRAARTATASAAGTTRRSSESSRCAWTPRSGATSPSVAMALVIDRSGSMSGLPLEMAKARREGDRRHARARRSARGHRLRLAAHAHRAR